MHCSFNLARDRPNRTASQRDEMLKRRITDRSADRGSMDGQSLLFSCFRSLTKPDTQPLRSPVGGRQAFWEGSAMQKKKKMSISITRQGVTETQTDRFMN